MHDMRALLPALLLTILGSAFSAAIAQVGEMKEAEIPAEEKARETEIVLWCGDHEGEFRVVPVSTTNVEVINWTVEGAEPIKKIQAACTGFKHIYARGKGVRTCTKILVPASGRPKDYRIVDFTFTIKDVVWTKNPDEWFFATQQTETQALKACNLIIARELQKALVALKEAQALAENIEYGTSPFQPYGSGKIAWANMVESLEQVQAAEDLFRKEPGGFEEVEALLRFYYEWYSTFPHVHIPRLGFQETAVVDGLLRTGKYYAAVAKQRLTRKLTTGALKFTSTDSERAAREWSLGYISTFAYMLYESGKYLPSYELIRDAILIKQGTEIRWKEDLMRDLMSWVAGNPDFASALPEDTLKRFPGQIEHMVHKIQDSDHLDLIKQEGVEALNSMKAKLPNVAWDPPIDQVIENLKKGLPADTGGHGHH